MKRNTEAQSLNRIVYLITQHATEGQLQMFIFDIGLYSEVYLSTVTEKLL